ncbi:MAG: hypothetical protein LIP77_00155 [Planctomycetes bacterium]|nr:hypothetical protein [Planctomycetota bacterium]
MTDFEAVPSTLLLCFVGRHRGERLVEATKAAGARGGTIALGQSFGHSRILQALSLGDIHQDMVVTLMGRERAAVVQAVRTAAQADPRKLTGMALVLPVPRLFRRVGPCDGPEEHPPEDRSETMDSGYTLITVIVNAGYGESVMAAARQAGASGGTILNARGTGTAED